MTIKSEESFERALKNFEARKDVIPENQADIIRFLGYLKAVKRGYNRRLKYLSNLTTLSALLGKPFSEVSRDDVEKLVNGLEGKYSANTQRDFKLEIRRFISWLRGFDKKNGKREYSPEVSWLEGFTAERRNLTREELLDEKDIFKMVEKAKPRDKAIIRTLYITGIRASELLGLKVKDFYQDNGLWVLRVEGTKTISASRKIPIIDEETVKALLEWLAFRSNPDGESWLWVDRKGELLQDRTLLKTLWRIGKKAGINKPLYPHSFRHAWATRTGNDKAITLSQFCYLGGWSQNSKVPITYMHTNERDVFEAFMRIRGEKNGVEKELAVIIGELLAKAFENKEVFRVVLEEMKKHETLYDQLKKTANVSKTEILLSAPNERSKKSPKKRH